MTTPADAAAPPAEPAPAPAEPAPARRRGTSWAEVKMDLKWGTALLFTIILVVSGFIWGPWQGPTTGTEELDQVTQEIFAQDGLVVPFEILSLLLLAALIAGLVIAFREHEGGI